MDIFLGIIDSIARIITFSWWIILPILLFALFLDIHLVYIRTRQVESIEWSFLEIKIPKEILKTPKAMEQIFSGLAATYSFGPTFLNIYIEGKFEPWLSFEIAGYPGGVNFYVRLPSKYRNLLESAIYAQYPDAEIHEAEDYTELVPSPLPNEVYDLWGTTLILAKDTYYPIRTYSYFEEVQEEKRLDPIAAITEVMSNLKDGETIWLQVLVSPTGAASGNNWQKDGQKKIDEIAGRKSDKAKAGLGPAIADFFRNLFWAPMEHPIWPEEKKADTSALVKFLDPYEQEIVKAIGNKIAKFGFETVIRFVYIDRKDSFTSANVSAIIGAFHQLSTQNLNIFKPDKRTMTLKTGWLAYYFPIYKKLVEFSRKIKVFKSYKARRFGSYNKTRGEVFPVFNTEELATIYHFPAIMVEAPRLKRLETKKGGPPAGLPIE